MNLLDVVDMRSTFQEDLGRIPHLGDILLLVLPVEEAWSKFSERFDYNYYATMPIKIRVNHNE